MNTQGTDSLNLCLFILHNEEKMEIYSIKAKFLCFEIETVY